MPGASISGTVKLYNPTSFDITGQSTDKIFLSTPDVNLPAYAPSASGSMWLNTSITTPTLSDFYFV